MLYVSRYIGDGHFGVVDTDDDVEQEVSIRDIETAVNGHNLQIAGVRKIPGLSRRYTARPYQNPATVTQLQVKTSTLCGVDVMVYKNLITRVSGKQLKHDGVVRVRLSQFGDTICSQCFYENDSFREGKTILVLDNALSYEDCAFQQPVCAGVTYDNQYYGVTFDLHELSDENAIFVYRGLLESIELAFLKGAVIDTDERTARVQSGGYDYVYG